MNEFNIITHIARLPIKGRLTREEKAGFAACRIKAASLSPGMGEEADRILSQLENCHEEIVTDKDLVASLYRQGGRLGEEVRSSSYKFVRDSLPNGQKAPEEGSKVEYSRPADSLIFARHLAELKEKSKGGEVNPQRASSVLTRDEARQYLRKGTLPATLRAF